MDQRQLEKERIRLTREISMLETQLTAAIRGKEEKLEENKQIREEIAILEEENTALEEETRKLDEEIAKLDEEFKQAQLDAGRLRREIKINNERADTESKKAAELRFEIAKLEKNLDSLRLEIKREIDDRRGLEASLRKTNAQIDAMKTHWAAKTVTKRLEKQDWYKAAAEYEVPESVEEEPAPKETAQVAEAAEPKAPPKEEKKFEDSGGIDFSSD